MKKIFHIGFDDLDFEKQQEILTEAQEFVAGELQKEAYKLRPNDPWKETIREAYDFFSELDLDNFILEKADAEINRKWKKQTINLELEYS